MDDASEEALRHQYIYVPWGDRFDTAEAGKKLALDMARRLRRPLTVVSAVRPDVTGDDELARLAIVTERGGQIVDGGVVLAWGPTYKVMEKTRYLSKSVVVLVEWPSYRFAAGRS